MLILTTMLYCVEWTQYSIRPKRSAICNGCVFLGPPESSTQTASRSLQPFLRSSLGDKPNDRPTDHAIRSIKMGGALSGEAKFCYCVRLQNYNKYLLEQSTRHSTYRITFSSHKLYSAVRLDGLQCMWRHNYSFEESVSHRRSRQVTQLFTYLLTHKLFSSCIRLYLVSRARDWVMPASSVVL